MPDPTVARILADPARRADLDALSRVAAAIAARRAPASARRDVSRAPSLSPSNSTVTQPAERERDAAPILTQR